jgi:hypothetical protein
MKNEVEPRYEFRLFGLDLEPYENKLIELSEKVQSRQMQSVYLLAAGNPNNNVKIRGKVMDIKVLEQEYQGLEQWNPFLVGEFPLTSEVIKTVVFPALGVSPPVFAHSSYSLEEFVRELIMVDPDLSVAYVNKKRDGYDFNNCIAEIASITVNGAFIKTLCIESENPEKVLEAKRMLGIGDEEENVNYPLALKRIMGLVDLPASWKEIKLK